MKISRTSFILLIAIAAVATCGTSYAQTVLGSGGSRQTWSTAPSTTLGPLGDLNSNGAPYWDVPFLTFNAGGYWGNLANKVSDGA